MRDLQDNERLVHGGRLLAFGHQLLVTDDRLKLLIWINHIFPTETPHERLLRA